MEPKNRLQLKESDMSPTRFNQRVTGRQQALARS
jgi:hypothetical protein